MRRDEIPGEKKIVWLPKELADKFESLENIESMRVLANSVIESKKLDMTAENQNLEDDALRFKSFCLSHRSELIRVYSEECDLIEKMWEELSEKSDGARQKIRDMAKEITEFSRSVSALKEQLSGLQIYQAEKFLQLSNTINNMDDNTRDILKRILVASQAESSNNRPGS